MVRDGLVLRRRRVGVGSCVVYMRMARDRSIEYDVDCKVLVLVLWVVLYLWGLGWNCFGGWWGLVGGFGV